MTLLAAGIVNPFGPTLSAVSVIGDAQGQYTDLVSIMLNPFKQEVVPIGRIALPVQWASPAVLTDYWTFAGSCPTLLLPSVHLSTEIAAAACSQFLQRFPDAANVLDRVKRHFANPWDRVSEEVQGMVEQLTEQGGGSSTPRPAHALDSDQAFEMAELLLSTAHTVPELQAFNYAWNGAIAHAPDLPAMNLVRFLAYFMKVTESCVVPHDDPPRVQATTKQ